MLNNDPDLIGPNCKCGCDFIWARRWERLSVIEARLVGERCEKALHDVRVENARLNALVGKLGLRVVDGG